MTATTIPVENRKDFTPAGATIRRNSLTHGATRSYPGGAMSDSEELTSTTSDDDFKSRLKAIGWTQRDFADLLGFHFTTLTKWKGGIPTYALRVLEFLEASFVTPAWRGTRARPEPTEDDARKALQAGSTTLIDNAIRQGWSRAHIAAALRTFADQTDGSAATIREKEGE